jgi:hypothetical protein
VLRFLFFNALLFGCFFYALRRGGGPEKAASTIIVVGSLLSGFAVSDMAHRFSSLEVGVLAADIGTLIGLLLVALFAERYWPLWVAALQTIGTAAHAVRLADPTVLRWAYAFALAFWSYPMLLLIIAGTWRHQKRLRLHGVDKSWSSFSGRWGLGRRLGPPG